MSSAASFRLWLLIGLAVATLLAANAHLLYLAQNSQPTCVAHTRPGDRGNSSRMLVAAQSSCSPLKQGEAS